MEGVDLEPLEKIRVFPKYRDGLAEPDKQAFQNHGEGQTDTE